MEFIDHTGHIFSLPSYSEYPVGYEYETNDYIFWLDNKIGRLSIDNFYMLPIRPLLCNSTFNKVCQSKNIKVGSGDSSFETTVSRTYHHATTHTDNTITADVEIEHVPRYPDVPRYVKDIHISVESNYYKLVGSTQIQQLVSSNKNIAEYITLDGESDLHSFLKKADLSIIEDLEEDDKTYMFLPFYIVGNANEEGTWMTNVLIHVVYEDGEEWCPITVGGVFYDENEPLIINGKNMGIDLPNDILKACYETSFWNETPNTALYNDKIKEALLAYNHIKMQAGNFISVIDSLKWFGYGKHLTLSKLLRTDNQFLEQYILDRFEISNDVLYSYRTFRNSTYITLQLADNQDTGNIENIDLTKDWFMGEDKPIMESLFNKLTEVRYDERDISFYKPYYDFVFDELGLKIACLKYYYEKYFLPIHLSVHGASITHKVHANDIKLIQGTEVKTCNPPLTTHDPNIDVVFPGEEVRYIYNHVLYTDENYNVFSKTYDYAAHTKDMAYYVNDVCVDIPITFMSNKNMQFYDCVLILLKEGKQIYESHFSFSQNKRPLDSFKDAEKIQSYIDSGVVIKQVGDNWEDENGNILYTIDNEYLKFVIVPKVFNTNFDINYWLNKDFEIKLHVNGKWFSYKFKIRLPEFIFNFGRLVYKYNVTSNFNEPRELKPSDAEYVDPSSPEWYEGINTRYDKVSFANYFRQVNKISEDGVDFNSFMYVPSLVEVNDINFVPNLGRRAERTASEMQEYANNWHVNQIQISNIKFPLPTENDAYAYGDTVNGYYRLSVEETSKVKTLKITYQYFLNWHDYVAYMSGDDVSDNVIYNAYIEYDFVNNTIITKYPEYNKNIIDDWEGDRKKIEWSYTTNEAGEVLPFEQNDTFRNMNYLELQDDGSYMHITFTRYASTNAVYNYIRSNSTFATYDLPLKEELGNTIIGNGYLGLAIKMEGELQNGHKFSKLKYAEPRIRNIEVEHADTTGDYCPFSEMCNDCCGNTCKHRRPTLSDRPKDDEGHYILTDEFSRTIDTLDRIGKLDEEKTYSDIVLKNIAALINKYRESPVIVDNKKYLNRVHMYHLHDAKTGEMLKYDPTYDNLYPEIVRDEDNSEKLTMKYMNTMKGDDFTPNKDFFFHSLYKQPQSIIDMYRQFFWDNGDAKLLYPAQNYFDFDTYLMHDDEYWYVVFISTMTIDNILTDDDLVARKTIYFNSDINEGSYFKLSSGAYMNMTDKILYNKNADGEFVKIVEDVEVSNGIFVPCHIRQAASLHTACYIIDRRTNAYLKETEPITLNRYMIVHTVVGTYESYVVKFKNNLAAEDGDLTAYRDIAAFDTKGEAEAFVQKLKFDARSEAESYIEELGEEERKHYGIDTIYDITKLRNKYYVVRYEEAGNKNSKKTIVTGDEEPIWDRYEAELFIQQMVDSHMALFNIEENTMTVYEYVYYNDATNYPIIVDEVYKNPLFADNYGIVEQIRYELKWQRSANQFLINRMYFIDSGGVNHFRTDDLIVASLDSFNTNFPYVFDIGTKWKFTPMSLGMSSSALVESSTNSAIISIGKGNKIYSKGYYDIDVRYSVDAYNNHQYSKKARLLIQ